MDSRFVEKMLDVTSWLRLYFFMVLKDADNVQVFHD